MEALLEDIGYAILIGGVIGWMTLIKDPKTKALVYSLPLPIVFAYLATGSPISSLNIVGLSLVLVFLWSAYYFHSVLKWNIFISDILSATVYMALGFGAVYGLPAVAFEAVIFIYMLLWICFCLLYRPVDTFHASATSDRIHPSIKFTGATILSFVLLRAKSLLAEIIVTFPFSGVFAVIESRRSLATQAAIVTRNSPAVLAMFAVLHYGQATIPRVALIALAIVIYCVVLWLIYRYNFSRV